MATSTRRLTQNQFSPGTSIDGNRLDRAMQDTIEHFNKLPPGSIAKRHTQHQLVMGWTPSITADQPAVPFTPMYNSDLTVVATTAVPDEGVQNPWRTKGSGNPNIDPTTATAFDQQWLWTTAQQFTKPVILSGVSLFMLNDTSYLNDFLFGVAPPPGKSTGASVDDLFLEVSVDNPFLPENRTQSAVEFHKSRFRVDSCKFSELTGAAFTDMQPAHPITTSPTGIAINHLDLNIPLPQNCRVRFSVGIPEYRAGYDSGWQTSPQNPWNGCVWSAVLTYLDPQEAA